MLTVLTTARFNSSKSKQEKQMQKGVLLSDPQTGQSTNPSLLRVPSQVCPEPPIDRSPIEERLTGTQS